MSRFRFFDHKFVEPLDQEGIGYVIVAKMTRKIKNKMGNRHYHSFRRDWAVARFFYQPFRWKKPHRFVLIRRPLPEKDSEQLTFFTLKRCAYQVFVTNLSPRAEKIWYFYRPTAAMEVVMGELKESYALAKIPNNNFQTNQFYFHLLVFAYNIVNWFKRLWNSERCPKWIRCSYVDESGRRESGIFTVNRSAGDSKLFGCFLNRDIYQHNHSMRKKDPKVSPHKDNQFIAVEAF